MTSTKAPLDLRRLRRALANFADPATWGRPGGGDATGSTPWHGADSCAAEYGSPARVEEDLT